MTILLFLFKRLCLLALILVAVAAAITGLVELFNLCPGFSANTGLSCGGAWYEGLANAAMGFLLISVVTVVPVVLAIAGLVFAVIAMVRRRRAGA